MEQPFSSGLKAGDSVEMDETILEITTDKVDSEILHLLKELFLAAF